MNKQEASQFWNELCKQCCSLSELGMVALSHGIPTELNIGNIATRGTLLSKPMINDIHRYY